MSAMRRILFATDFSKASRKAFSTAMAMAKANRAALTIVHVVVPFTPIVPEQYLSGETWEQIDNEARRVSRQQLHRLVARARKAGIRVVGLLQEGDPAQQIVLQDYIHAVEDAETRIVRLVEQIEQLLGHWSMAPVVTAIQAMRGVAFINAITIVAEIGDLRGLPIPANSWPMLGLCHPSIPRATVCEGAASRRPAIIRLVGS